MIVDYRRIKPRLMQFLAARRRTRRMRSRLALSIFLLGSAFAGGEALTQAGGCARCGGAVIEPGDSGFSPQGAFVERSWREDRPRRRRTERSLVTRVEAAGGNYTVCVRACDGGFFPVSYFGASSRADSLGQVCRSLCPNAEVALYSFPLGGTIDEAVSSAGEPYARLPNAHKFEQSYDASCSCRAAGQSWAEALAEAEARYGRRSDDILVTAEQSARMSRPAHDPKGKAGAPTTGANAEVEQPLDLDVNDVDTKLGAAAAAMSRETSGIKNDDAQRTAHFALNQGRTLEETGPDGSVRRVRVLPATF
jgi:hypothetical protein